MHTYLQEDRLHTLLTRSHSFSHHGGSSYPPTTCFFEDDASHDPGRPGREPAPPCYQQFQPPPPHQGPTWRKEDLIEPSCAQHRRGGGRHNTASYTESRDQDAWSRAARPLRRVGPWCPQHESTRWWPPGDGFARVPSRACLGWALLSGGSFRRRKQGPPSAAAAAASSSSSHGQLCGGTLWSARRCPSWTTDSGCWYSHWFHSGARSGQPPGPHDETWPSVPWPGYTRSKQRPHHHLTSPRGLRKPVHHFERPSRARGPCPKGFISSFPREYFPRSVPCSSFPPARLLLLSSSSSFDHARPPGRRPTPPCSPAHCDYGPAAAP